MALFYADEDFDFAVVVELRRLGHDVICVHEVGRKGNPDSDVPSFATSLGRVVLTFNHKDFRRLHLADPAHTGIVSCSRDADFAALARRIDGAVATISNVAGRFVRIVTPP